MQQKEFSLRECYVLSCYGLRAAINAGRLEGFSKEEENEIQEHVSDDMLMKSIGRATNG